MDFRAYISVDQRRKAVEKELNADLVKIGNCTLDTDMASSRNCENMIGATQIPLGIAGPLKITGSIAKNEYYIPLATTEGALVASVSRGCKAIAQGGSIQALAYKVGTTRGPVFYTGSINKSKELYDWIKANNDQIARVSEKTSKHLKFLKAEVKTQGAYAFIRFYFDTKDAMGMNMVTIASEQITNLIEKELKIECLSLAGNYDSDKKPAWINFINNRGYKVWAEAIISSETVESVLKTTSEKFFETWLAKCMIGSAMSGSMGFNAHYANIAAAFFTATGQDLAHTVEASMGLTTAKVLKTKDLYFSVYLPAVMLGIVGGGTGLDTQKESLSIIKAKSALELAEVFGGAVLAGELSLLASLSEKSLVNAHQKLARGGTKR